MTSELPEMGGDAMRAIRVTRWRASEPGLEGWGRADRFTAMSMEDDAKPMRQPLPDPLVHDAKPAVDPTSERTVFLDDPEETGEDGGGEDGQLTLTFEEARVLGSLMEKSQTTPDHYPLTMNALVAACNQKSSREPVVTFDDDQVEEALAGLGRKRLAARISVAGSRVPKYKHTLDIGLPALDERGIALLTPLLLRGQQTVSELRTRTERMYHFADLDATQAALEALRDYPGRDLVKHLPSGGGRRVPTWVQVITGDVPSGPMTAFTAAAPAAAPPAAVAPPAAAAPAAEGWREEMEAEFGKLREEVSTLRKELDEFRSQFG